MDLSPSALFRKFLPLGARESSRGSTIQNWGSITPIQPNFGSSNPGALTHSQWQEFTEKSARLGITVGARSSMLSQAQVKEVYEEIKLYHPFIEFHPIFLETTGDRDLNLSLRTMDKTDFFTKEIDALQLSGGCRLSIHSAKDLPDPLPQGLRIVALTRGVDSSDAFVLREKENIEDLPLNARVGTSSVRREKAVKSLRSDLICVDIRGSIDRRLSLLDNCDIDALVMAEAALIRLQLTHRHRIKLSSETAALQGQLAILSRIDDQEMQKLFACIDSINLNFGFLS